jgi:hypothetical protein
MQKTLKIFFWLHKYQKVPRAYENLNPALGPIPVRDNNLTEKFYDNFQSKNLDEHQNFNILIVLISIFSFQASNSRRTEAPNDEDRDGKKLKLKKKKKEILKKSVKPPPTTTTTKRKVYLEKSQIGRLPSPEDISSDPDIPDDPYPSTSDGKLRKSEKKKVSVKPSLKSDQKSRTKKVRRMALDVRQLPSNDRTMKRPLLEEEYHHRKRPTDDRQMSKIERFAAVIQEENVRHVDRHHEPG